MEPGSRSDGAHRRSARPIWLLFGIVVVLGGLTVGWIARHVLPGGAADRRDLELDTRPLIVSLQQLHDLHTARVNLRDVLKQESDQTAAPLFRQVPGADEVTKWATRNEAIVVADGSVEAGIDLSRITDRDVTQVRKPDGTRVVRVRLPEPTIYPPQISIRVVQSRSGLLWKDENLVPRAQEQASRLFIEAAEKGEIRRHARENAVQTLQRMESALGGHKVEFTF